MMSSRRRSKRMKNRENTTTQVFDFLPNITNQEEYNSLVGIVNGGSKKEQTKFEAISDQLKALGVEPDKHEGNCVRAAIYNGHIKLTGDPSDLEQVVHSGTLPDCGHKCSVTLKTLLGQPDYGGAHFQDALEEAVVYCDEIKETEAFGCSGTHSSPYSLGRTFVTGMCSGNPKFDNGDYTNHCARCSNFGVCLGDYRDGHCIQCDKHYFAGEYLTLSCECRMQKNKENHPSGLNMNASASKDQASEKPNSSNLDEYNELVKIVNEASKMEKDNSEFISDQLKALGIEPDDELVRIVKEGSKKEQTKFEVISDQLKALGVEPDEHEGNCVRAAIYNGHIKLTGDPSDLEQVVHSGKLECGHDCSATLKDLLMQPDYAGTDFEDGLEEAVVFCDELKETEEFGCTGSYSLGRTYVTGICSGKPEFDCGKFTNHCATCSNFGVCLGDYREGHCTQCDEHYFAGTGLNLPCDCRDQGDSTDSDDSDSNDSSSSDSNDSASD